MTAALLLLPLIGAMWWALSNMDRWFDEIDGDE